MFRGSRIPARSPDLGTPSLERPDRLASDVSRRRFCTDMPIHLIGVIPRPSLHHGWWLGLPPQVRKGRALGTPLLLRVPIPLMYTTTRNEYSCSTVASAF